MSNRDLALIYDYLLCQGGAEQLSLELARALDCELWSAFVDPEQFPPALLHGVDLHSLDVPATHPVWRALRSAWAFTALGPQLKQQRVIFSGSYAPLAVLGRDQSGNLYYCHTPPRFIYDLRDWYLAGLPFWQRPLLRALIAYLRPEYERAIARMERVVANSETVRKRLSVHLGVESQVVYPPCRTDRYRWYGRGGYYLSTARLEPYKRVDLIIEAFRQLPGERLLIASGGSDERRLRSLAADLENVSFCGWVDQSQLERLVGESIATLYLPREEDFGISPVESMAAGKPVIGVAEGGVAETVIDGETGRLLPSPPTVEGLVEAVNWLSRRQAESMRDACEARAARFGRDRFAGQMQALVESL